MMAVVTLPFATCVIACFMLAVPAVLKKGLKWWTILCVNACLIVYTVSFVSVVAKCLEVLDCTYVSEDKLELVMKSLPTVQCYRKEWHEDYFTVVLPVLIVYLVMPFALFAHLQRLGFHHVWDGSSFEYRAFGSFYRKYRTGKWKMMFEAVVLLRKLCIVASVTLLSSYPYRACMSFALVLVASIVIQLLASPFEGKLLTFCLH